MKQDDKGEASTRARHIIPAIRNVILLIAVAVSTMESDIMAEPAPHLFVKLKAEK